MSRANIKITKVKVSDEIEIHYEERRENGFGTVEFTSPDKPRKSFIDAFAALKSHLIEMCECPEEWEEEIEINSLSLNYKGERKTMGAVITATRKLLHSKIPMNLFTPHKTINEAGVALKGDGRLYLTPDCVTAIGVVTGEAKLFLDGARINDDQLTIFNEFEHEESDEENSQTEIEDEISAKRSVSPETEKVFGMGSAIADDGEKPSKVISIDVDDETAARLAADGINKRVKGKKREPQKR